MNDLSGDGQFQTARKGACRYYHGPDLSLEEVMELLRQPGEVLKASPKSQVRRVGGFVIKESRGGWIRHTLRRDRYRNAWRAALRLRAAGVAVPEPLAYGERGLLGIGTGAFMISRFLPSYRNVEVFLQALVQRSAGQDTLRVFLAGLADAVNRLTDTGVYHSDLSGKNIFTRDGEHFVFIDLDAVELTGEYTDERRLKNHIQLYDSFCDQVTDVLLVPFITRMLTVDQDPRVWMPRVRKGQAARRRRYDERQERQRK